MQYAMYALLWHYIHAVSLSDERLIYSKHRIHAMVFRFQYFGICRNKKGDGLVLPTENMAILILVALGIIGVLIIITKILKTQGIL